MDIRSRKQTKSMLVLEVLAEFISSIDDYAGQWYNTGNNDIEDKNFKYLFLSLSTIFRLHKDTLSIFFLEANLIKKRGNKFVISMRGCSDLKNIVNSYISTEILKYKVDKFKLMNLLKLEYVSLTPMTILDSECQKNMPFSKISIKRSDQIYLEFYNACNGEQ